MELVLYNVNYSGFNKTTGEAEESAGVCVNSKLEQEQT